MKRAIAVIILGLLWCSASFAQCIKGNCQNGQGTYTFADGRVDKGIWKYGKVVEVLDGKKLYCKSVDNAFSEHVALVFIENYQVKLSYMWIFGESVSKPYDTILQETFDYQVGEDTITILTSLSLKKILRWDIHLDRINLDLYGSGKHVKCKIVNYDPLEKFKEKYQKLNTPKKKKKKI